MGNRGLYLPQVEVGQRCIVRENGNNHSQCSQFYTGNESSSFHQEQERKAEKRGKDKEYELHGRIILPEFVVEASIKKNAKGHPQGQPCLAV